MVCKRDRIRRNMNTITVNMSEASHRARMDQLYGSEQMRWNTMSCAPRCPGPQVDPPF